MKSVLILGANGMLGSMCKYFLLKKGVYVDEFNDRLTLDTYEDYKNKINDFKSDIIINCIGKIPQKIIENNTTDLEYYVANCILPKLLSEVNNRCIIHASTDCVFEPSSYKNNSNDLTNAVDAYGRSKAMGDAILNNRANTYILRGSIIGVTENNQSEGLLDWFIRQDSKNVQGFSHHLWNGITTLAWVKFLYENFLLTNNYLNLSTVTHLGSASDVNKYDLLVCIKEIYNLDINIKEVSSALIVDRTLSVDVYCGEIRKQIMELHNEKIY
jgi:dTDP-4-dehydrorhamnose reductase